MVLTWLRPRQARYCPLPIRQLTPSQQCLTPLHCRDFTHPIALRLPVALIAISVILKGASIQRLLLRGRLRFLNQFEAIFGTRISFFIFDDVLGHVLLHVLLGLGEGTRVVFLSFVWRALVLGCLADYLLNCTLFALYLS